MKNTWILYFAHDLWLICPGKVQRGSPRWQSCLAVSMPEVNAQSLNTFLLLTVWWVRCLKARTLLHKLYYIYWFGRVTAFLATAFFVFNLIWWSFGRSSSHTQRQRKVVRSSRRLSQKPAASTAKIQTSEAPATSTVQWAKHLFLDANSQNVSF